MTPEQATFLLNEIYLPQMQSEQKTTRRVIEAIPAGKCDWKPEPKSMAALELASHIASSECFFLNGIASGAFNSEDHSATKSLTSPADLIQWYDENFANGVARVSSLKGDDLVRVIDFHGVFKMPAIAFAQVMCNHSIHHRGQLSSYLRPMGSKVPSIYGGSADEPMQMPAQA
jgi:uncharacterized damage-inducible protein DinB